MTEEEYMRAMACAKLRDATDILHNLGIYLPEESQEAFSKAFSALVELRVEAPTWYEVEE